MPSSNELVEQLLALTLKPKTSAHDQTTRAEFERLLGSNGKQLRKEIAREITKDFGTDMQVAKQEAAAAKKAPIAAKEATVAAKEATVAAKEEAAAAMEEAAAAKQEAASVTHDEAMKAAPVKAVHDIEAVTSLESVIG